MADGLRRTGSGWQAYVRVGGEFRSKHFKPDTSPTVMRDWLADQRARYRLRDELAKAVAPTGHTLAADAARYLPAVASLVSYRTRKQRILSWVDALGPDTPRSAITAAKIRAVLEQWKLTGMSGRTLNLYRAALMHVWTVLDGRSQPNPVKDVPPYHAASTPLVLPTIAQARKALATMRPTSKHRARLELLLWTGWPPAQIRKLTPDDIDWKAKRVLVRGRLKGAGTRDRHLPVLPQALAALKRFAAVKAWGDFDGIGLYRAWRRACEQAHIGRYRVYDLRHLFLTTVALATKDDRVVAELAMHTNPTQTRRYTEQSVGQRMADGLRAVQAKVARSGQRRAKSKKLSTKRRKATV